MNNTVVSIRSNNKHAKIRPIWDFDESKYMSFLINEDELLKKYNEIWEKVKNSIRKESDRKPVYNEEYLKVKINPIMEKLT